MDFTHFFNLHLQLKQMFQMGSSFTGDNQYYLYMPKNKKAEKIPLLVMLHGTTQNALSFAGQTKMNELAEEHGFAVAYVDKNMLANPTKAFDWITPYENNNDVKSVESLIERLVNEGDIDSQKVYVAGLSAGAALTAILVENNPHLISGAAIIGGLPPDSANSMMEAVKAMYRGSSSEDSYLVENPQVEKQLDILIIHGNEDKIVSLENANITYEAMTKLIDFTHDGVENESRTINKTVEVLENGNIIRTSKAQNGSSVVFEEINGMGHVWRGGDMAFSYSDRGEENNDFSVSERIIEFFRLDRLNLELSLPNISEKIQKMRNSKNREKKLEIS